MITQLFATSWYQVRAPTASGTHGSNTLKEHSSILLLSYPTASGVSIGTARLPFMYSYMYMMYMYMYSYLCRRASAL